MPIVLLARPGVQHLMLAPGASEHTFRPVGNLHLREPTTGLVAATSLQNSHREISGDKTTQTYASIMLS
jgi:hypothetical protein